MEHEPITIWGGPAIVRLSRETVSTCDPPSKKRSATRFAFPCDGGRIFFIYDHRERSSISAKIYIENVGLLSTDVNRKGYVEIKKRDDGTEYAVIHDIKNDDHIFHAFEESPMTVMAAEWKKEKDGRTISVSRFK